MKWVRVSTLTGALGILTAGAAAGAPGGPAPRLAIFSDSSCPSGEAVGQALSNLRPGGDWPSGQISIHVDDRFLTVDLGTAGANRRRLAVTPDCTARASMVAVVIATWMGDLPAEDASGPVLSSGTKPETIPPPQVVAVASDERHPDDEYDLGAGLLVATSGGIAPGLRLDFQRTRTPYGLGWQAGFVLPARRELSTSLGEARWTRPSLSLALNGRLDVGSYSLSADAGLAGSYTFASGQDYKVAQDAQSFTLGIAAGLRLGIPWRSLRVWTDLRMCQWLLVQSIQIDSASGAPMASASLPSWDAQLSLGLSYVFR